MSDRYPEVRVREDGQLVVREVLDFSYYVRHPHQKIAPQVIRSLKLFIAATGAPLRWWSGYDEHNGEWVPMDELGLARLSDELLQSAVACTILSDQEWAESRYGFSYRGQRPEDLQADPSAACALRFYLPTEGLERQGPANMRGMALDLLGDLPAGSGNVGLTLNMEPLAGVWKAMYEHCYRYPGFDLATPNEANSARGTRVAGPSWLTFIGQPVLEQLGGISGLRSRLKLPGTTVQELEGDRVMVTLGEWPEAGDASEGRTLPAYRELASTLEPWLFRQREGYSGFFNSEADLRRWERRFLD